MCRGDPVGFFVSPRYAERAEEVYNFKIRSDDCWVVTFPKCGTTWTQELVWLVANDCDFEKARSTVFHFSSSPCYRRPSKKDIEFLWLSCRNASGNDNVLFTPFERMSTLPSPRFIKRHLPLYLLPPNLLNMAKVIYVARNPKDVINSYLHHHQLINFQEFTKGLDEFVDHFIKGQVMYAPFFPHFLEAWNMRHHPSLLFLFYEDMKRDLKGQIKKVAEFLNKQLTEEQLEKLAVHLRFDNFAKNESVNRAKGKETGFFKSGALNFIRTGKVGDWKNYFTPKSNSRIDEWINENLSGTDLKFTMQLDHQN